MADERDDEDDDLLDEGEEPEPAPEPEKKKHKKASHGSSRLSDERLAALMMRAGLERSQFIIKECYREILHRACAAKTPGDVAAVKGLSATFQAFLVDINKYAPDIVNNESEKALTESHIKNATLITQVRTLRSQLKRATEQGFVCDMPPEEPGG